MNGRCGFVLSWDNQRDCCVNRMRVAAEGLNNLYSMLSGRWFFDNLRSENLNECFVNGVGRLVTM
jgi:hypothetical protein